MLSYRTDLAYIHHEGFSGYARQSAPGLLRFLRENGADEGLIVDLGCGNGVWPRALIASGYRTIGVDASAAMIRLARTMVPGAEFVVSDIDQYRLPRCAGVTSIGEVLSYVFHRDEGNKRFFAFLRRVYTALQPGGVFIFDIATNGRAPAGMPRKGFWTGDDWAVLVEAVAEGDVISRHLTSFRKRGRCWRRSTEVHRLRMYEPDAIQADLRSIGFVVKRVRAFGGYRFHSGHAAFVCRK